MLYDIAFFIFAIFYLPALIFKGKMHKGFLERFGIYDEEALRILNSDSDRIWIQAVSVGEVGLCKGLIPLLKKEFPKNEIVLSTITKTGNDLAKKIFSKDAVIIYFPLDFAFIVRKAVSLIRPKMYIMIETEIWPNLLKELKSNSALSILINGRISDRSFGKYKLAAPFLKNILNKINLFCMQSRIDAERVMAIRAPADRVSVTGNMKFDIETCAGTRPPQYVRESLKLKEGEELFVAGSTHGGEEGIVIDVFRRLSAEFPNIRLVIAPRHIERVNEVEGVVRKFDYEPVRISSLTNHQSPITNHRIYILDTIGGLSDIYSIATIVFIGGSLVRHGGQNPIEPALFEKPVLFGPHMFNFRDISSIFLKDEAARQVFGKEDFFEECRRLLNDESERAKLGRSARDTVCGNRGATARNIEAVKKLMVDGV